MNREILIASRQLMLKVNDKEELIEVNIFLPEQLDSFDYKCKYLIKWPNKEKKFYGCGIDSLQALLNALAMVKVEIMTSSFAKDQVLEWYENKIDYGFDVIRTVVD